MKFELFYPYWKEKAVTFSYDDGQIFDRQLVELMNRYQLKGTFHLNSAMLNKRGYVTSEELVSLYQGHEIACHGYNHEYLVHLPKELLINELHNDRLLLEDETDGIIRGCSYAFGEYNKSIKNTLNNLGFTYCRTVNNTESFQIPSDFLSWNPSCHHNELEKMIGQFLEKPDYLKLPLLYVWGHSFEFDRQKNWDYIEKMFRLISGYEDTWYVTNIEYADYIIAARNLHFSANGNRVVNLSKIPIYVKIDGKQTII